MSTFKKFALVLLAGIFMLMILAGCGGTGEYTGKIEDDTHLVNVDDPQLQNELHNLPWEVSITITNKFQGTGLELAAEAGHLLINGDANMMVILIDVVHRHIAIRDNAKDGILQSSQYDDAIAACHNAMGKNSDYVQGIIALMKSMRQADNENGIVDFWTVVVVIVIVLLALIGGASARGRGGRSSSSSSGWSYTSISFGDSSSSSGSGGGGSWGNI